MSAATSSDTIPSYDNVKVNLYGCNCVYTILNHVHTMKDWARIFGRFDSAGSQFGLLADTRNFTMVPLNTTCGGHVDGRHLHGPCYDGWCRESVGNIVYCAVISMDEHQECHRNVQLRESQYHNAVNCARTKHSCQLQTEFWLRFHCRIGDKIYYTLEFKHLEVPTAQNKMVPIITWDVAPRKSVHVHIWPHDIQISDFQNTMINEATQYSRPNSRGYVNLTACTWWLSFISQVVILSRLE